MNHEHTLQMVSGKFNKFGFDPAIITAIIDAIMTVIKKCSQKPTPEVVNEKPGIFVKLQMRRSLRASGAFEGIKDWKKVEDSVWEVVSSSTDKEIEDFCDCCCDCC